MVNVGIVGTGIYMPETKMTAKQISEATKGVWSESAVIEKLGIIEKQFPDRMMARKKWVYVLRWIV